MKSSEDFYAEAEKQIYQPEFPSDKAFSLKTGNAIRALKFHILNLNEPGLGIRDVNSIRSCLRVIEAIGVAIDIHFLSSESELITLAGNALVRAQLDNDDPDIPSTIREIISNEFNRIGREVMDSSWIEPLMVAIFSGDRRRAQSALRELHAFCDETLVFAQFEGAFSYDKIGYLTDSLRLSVEEFNKILQQHTQKYIDYAAALKENSNGKTNNPWYRRYVKSRYLESSR